MGCLENDLTESHRLVNRQRRLDNAVRQAFGLYESERRHGMRGVHRTEYLLGKRVERRTMELWEERELDHTLYRITRAYYAQ